MRDWNQSPPNSLADCFEFAKELAESACDHAFRVTGQRPRWEQRGNKLIIIWPDGEETNEIQIDPIGDKRN